jgi:antitoxin PrlF
MRTIKVRLNADRRLVIPVSIRRALGIVPGEVLVLQVEDDELRVSTLKRRIAQAQPLVRKHVKSGTSPVEELLSERRHVIR